MEQGRYGRGKAWMEKEKRAVETRGLEVEEERSGAGREESRRNERESETERDSMQMGRDRIEGRQE